MPLVCRRAPEELPRNQQHRKERLESGAKRSLPTQRSGLSGGAEISGWFAHCQVPTTESTTTTKKPRAYSSSASSRSRSASDTGPFPHDNSLSYTTYSGSALIVWFAH